MAVKSIISVDVQDASFRRFSELFDQYQAALAKTPNAWKAVGTEQAAIATQFERMGAALLAQNQMAKESEKEEKERLNRLTTSERLWTNIGKASGTLAKNVLDISAGVLKWGAFLAGGLTGGSLWGLDRLGASAADQRRSSSGLGLSVGEQQSFQTNFRRFVNPDSVLSGISSAVSNVALQGPLYGLGVDPNQSTADVALATLKRVRGLAQATPINQLGLLESSRHLDQLGFSVDDIRRLRSASPEEFNKQSGRFQSDVKALGFGDKTGEAWQDFTDQMHRAGQTIFKVLVEKLAPLAGPLTKLSDAVVHVIERFADGGAIAHAIDDFAKRIDGWTGVIGKPEFLDRVQAFASDVGALGDAIHAVVHPIDTYVKWASDYATRGDKEAEVQNYKNLISAQAVNAGVPAGLLQAQWAIESGGSMNGHLTNPTSGAIGPFQFMPATAKGLGIDPTDINQAAYGAAKLDQQLLKRYKGDIAAVIAAYDTKNFDAIYQKHPSDWQQYIPKETTDYLNKAAALNKQMGLGLTIRLDNATGGNVNTNFAQFTQ